MSLLLPAASVQISPRKIPKQLRPCRYRDCANRGPVTLPKDIVWETDNDEPLIGSDKAIKGGTFNYYIDEYPLTFRMMGPNSNDAFAWWNHAIHAWLHAGRDASRHRQVHSPDGDPVVDTARTRRRSISSSIPDAKFSDGHPITADDYVFTWKMMQSKAIVDPFYNSYAERYFQSVDKIDDHTLRIVGTRPSWRPLVDYAGLLPTPSHATVLDDTWVTRTTNEPQIAVGPYIVSNIGARRIGHAEAVPNWWGDKKRYFIGMYNFDEIHLRVIPPERELDYLRSGELDMKIEGTRSGPGTRATPFPPSPTAG